MKKNVCRFLRTNVSILFNILSLFRNLVKRWKYWKPGSNIKNELANTLVFVDILHGHAVLQKKRRHIRHPLETVRPRIFAPHFFTVIISLLEKLNHETKTRKLQLTEQGNFY